MKNIIELLKTERDKIQAAIDALSGRTPGARNRPKSGRPKGGLSAEGRAKIAAAAKRRWARVRRENAKKAK
jgi:hypothetical protein